MTWTTWGESLATLPPVLAWITIVVVIGAFYIVDITLDQIHRKIAEQLTEPEQEQEKEQEVTGNGT